MARYEHIDTNPKFLPVDLARQLLPGTFAYAHGIVSSRGIEAACRDHVTFIALSGDTAPHVTTLRVFESSSLRV